MDPDFLDWIRIFGQFGSVLREKAVFQIRVLFLDQTFFLSEDPNQPKIYIDPIWKIQIHGKNIVISYLALSTLLFLVSFLPKPNQNRI